MCFPFTVFIHFQVIFLKISYGTRDFASVAYIYCFITGVRLVYSSSSKPFGLEKPTLYRVPVFLA